MTAIYAGSAALIALIAFTWWFILWVKRQAKAESERDAAVKGLKEAKDANTVRADVRRLDDADLDAELRGRRK